jgi:hypothetical protein
LDHTRLEKGKMRDLVNFLGKAIGPIILILMTIAFVGIIYLQFGAASSNLQLAAPATRRACVPTPDRSIKTSNTQQSDLPPTLPTNWGLITPPIGPTVTIEPTAIVTDLAPDLPEKDKSWVYVLHCDGSIELFKVKPTKNLLDTLPLQPDDFILDAAPPVSMMVEPPYLTTQEPLPTPTNGPYPPPDISMDPPREPYP